MPPALINTRMPLLSTVVALLFIHGEATKTPNVVFILADDLGYNEMNWMNSTRGIQTPNLDALADEGIVLKNYYGKVEII